MINALSCCYFRFCCHYCCHIIVSSLRTTVHTFGSISCFGIDFKTGAIHHGKKKNHFFRDFFKFVAKSHLTLSIPLLSSLQSHPKNVPSGLKILVINGANDWFADVPNINRPVSELPLGTKHIVIPNFSHLDLVFGNTSRELVFDRVIAYISSGYLT